MKQISKIVLLSLVSLFPVILAKKRAHDEQKQSWSDWYYIAKSGATFHISLLYNKGKYGKDGLFHVICPASDRVAVKRNSQGVITAIHDGKKSPLLLGGIPCNQESLKSMKLRMTVPAKQHIELYTLNQDFECRWAGLEKLMKKNKDLVTQFKYPTIDNTAPSLENIIKAVDTLNTRDERNALVAYVHCKAGRGRSAAVVTAYLFMKLFEAGVKISVNELERFLQRCRPQVKLHGCQKQRLQEFTKALEAAGSFAKLKEKFVR